MRDLDARDPALPAAQAAAVQLRILSGAHQGAAMALEAQQWMRVGSDPDCDVWLSDCGLAAGESVLVGWAQGRWSVRSSVEPDAEQPYAESPDHPDHPDQPLGAVAMLGQVGATVCAEHAPWQAFVRPPAPSAQSAPASGQTDLAHDEAAEAAEAAEAGAAVPAAVSQPQFHSAVPQKKARMPRTRVWAGATLALVLLLGLGWSGWRQAPAATPATALAAASVLSPQARAQAVKDATLAIALVDPALRMRVVANAEGGVTVSGWVENVDQLDRLAQGLSGLRPLPRLAVRTITEVLDALSDVASEHGMRLRFAPTGPGSVQVQGVVTDFAMQTQVLAQVRARAPEGLEVIDGLHVASQQGPAVQRWLAAQGLPDAETRWDGEQLVLGMQVSPAQRMQLERALAAAQTPLTDVPFTLQTRVVQAGAPAVVAGRRLNADDAGLPFRIRSVVSGAAPYVMLADGGKLQLGATQSGWRLVAIAPDHMVFDGPKRLEVNR